ncbi:hypothetical protein [Brevundimonas phoenicis]
MAAVYRSRPLEESMSARNERLESAHEKGAVREDDPFPHRGHEDRDTKT